MGIRKENVVPRRLLSKGSLSNLDGELSDVSVISLNDLLSIILYEQHKLKLVEVILGDEQL
jgi:hypothetical protein